MASIPDIPILAPKRVPFDDVIPEYGVDYTGATLAMEIRADPGDQGTALVALGASTSGGEGLLVTYDPAYVDDEGGPPGASIVRIIINETTLEGLAYGGDPSKPVNLFYDIHLTPISGKKFVFAAGQFVITPGVTL